MLKITFTFGDTVKIILNQDTEGYYIYTPDNNLLLPIKFSCVKDAVLFFSKFLPVEVYDDEENSLSFVITFEYKDKSISFCMSDEDRTKIAWVDHIKGFNEFWSRNKKVGDSIDDVVWYFIKWVKTIPKEASVLTLTYSYFSSKVYQDSNSSWWYVSHILNKADENILKENVIIGKDIQELQTRFEDYICNYLIERNKQ